MRDREPFSRSLIHSLIFFIISSISAHSYELPIHHFPFCILQREYYYIGYLLYASLLSGAVSGIGVGALIPYRQIGSLASYLTAAEKRLTLLCLLSYLIFVGITVCRVATTDFILLLP